jgi:hypothetical protein
VKNSQMIGGWETPYLHGSVIGSTLEAGTPYEIPSDRFYRAQPVRKDGFFVHF